MWRINFRLLIALMGFFNSFVNAQDIPPTTSLVYPGIDGKLVYVTDGLGNKIPDLSNVGYKSGAGF